MKTRVKVQGLRELERALTQLPKGMGRAVLRQAAVETLEPMAETARRLAPDDPATNAPDLKSEIVISARQLSGLQIGRTRGEKDSVTVYMGPTPKAYPAALIQETGSGPHVIKPRRGKILAFRDGGESVAVPEVQHPGHAAQPYMRPAWEQHRLTLLPTLARLLGEKIITAAERLGRRQARLARKAKG